MLVSVFCQDRQLKTAVPLETAFWFIETHIAPIYKNQCKIVPAKGQPPFNANEKADIAVFFAPEWLLQVCA